MQRENPSPVYRAISSARAALVPWAEDMASAVGLLSLEPRPPARGPQPASVATMAEAGYIRGPQPASAVGAMVAEAEAHAYQTDRARGPQPASVATMATEARATTAEAMAHATTAEAHGGLPTAAAHGGLPMVAASASALAGQPTAAASRPFQDWHVSPVAPTAEAASATMARGLTGRPGPPYLARPGRSYTAASAVLHGGQAALTRRPAPSYMKRGQRRLTRIAKGN